MRALFLSIYIACTYALPVQADITVFAPASLKTALDELAEDWVAAGGEDVRLSYGGSGALARQVLAGAPADIFISAHPDWMDAAEAGDAIRGESRRSLLGNRLVLVAPGPAAPPVALTEAALDRALGGGRLATGLVTAVPAGQYGRAALEALGLWDGLATRLAETDNVRAALLLVALGEAPLGIVYATDATAEPRVAVVATFPEESHPPIRYPAALTAAARPEAAAFLDWLAGPEAMAVFAAQGFLPGSLP